MVSSKQRPRITADNNSSSSISNARFLFSFTRLFRGRRIKDKTKTFCDRSFRGPVGKSSLSLSLSFSLLSSTYTIILIQNASEFPHFIVSTYVSLARSKTVYGRHFRSSLSIFRSQNVRLTCILCSFRPLDLLFPSQLRTSFSCALSNPKKP
jgi:hypothetical protein